MWCFRYSTVSRAGLVCLFFFASWLRAYAQPSADLNLEALRDAAGTFVAEELSIERSEVLVPALDRRARLPVCPEPLAFRWPFSSRGTVEAFCPSTDARLFLRVIVKGASGPRSKGMDQQLGWQVARPVAAGEMLSGEDLEPAHGPSPEVLPYRGPKPQASFRLRALTPITPGAPIPASAVRLERKVLRADASLTAQLRLPHPQLTETWVPAEGLAGDTLSPEDVPKLVALARPLRAGAILRASDLLSAVLVQKGATVRVAIHQGLMVLEADLIAEEDGALGESVVVLNSETGRRLRATVTGPGRAEHQP
jgi:flagella basal body P-ring formation protein FlgA